MQYDIYFTGKYVCARASNTLNMHGPCASDNMESNRNSFVNFPYSSEYSQRPSRYVQSVTIYVETTTFLLTLSENLEPPLDKISILHHAW